MWHNHANEGDETARSRGFTLIEMMVVMSIMIMMITISIPALDAFLVKQGPKSGARIVQSTLFAAKMTAIRDRRNASFDVRPLGSICGFKVEETERIGGPYVVTADKSSNVRWIDNFFVQSKDSKGRKIPGTERFLRLRYPGNREKVYGKIFKNTINTITVKRMEPRPGEMVDIMDSEEVDRYCVSPDRESEVWEMLPQWVEVSAFPGEKQTLNALPVTFKPDGSLHFEGAHYPRVTVRIKDTRPHVDVGGERNEFLIVVRRNTGSIRTEQAPEE